jgi:hypothetical protein
MQGKLRSFGFIIFGQKMNKLEVLEVGPLVSPTVESRVTHIE